MPPRTGKAQVLCTVDVVLLTLTGDQGAERASEHKAHADGLGLSVLLHERPLQPFEGVLALPGGYLHPDEDESAWHAAARVLRAKTGVESPYLEQLATWSGPTRDPRGFSLSVVYYALVARAELGALRPGTRLAPVDALPKLAFDHAQIVAHAVARVRSKSHYSSLPVYLCGDEFTLPELQAVYEAVLGAPLNKVSFRRKIDELGMLAAVPGKQTGGAHRPAQVYRLKPGFQRRLAVVDRGLG
jgi:8-oxo-dGTP diphosphatase